MICQNWYFEHKSVLQIALSMFGILQLLPALNAATATATGNLNAFDTAPRCTLKPIPPKERLVGIAYSTWHQNRNWTHVWGTPELGFYRSDDTSVIRRHAQWLSDAGVDFIWIDWSNDLHYSYNPATPRPDFDMIEDSTFEIFNQYSHMRAKGEKTPKISIFIGNPDDPSAISDGKLQRKADQVWDQFESNPVYRPLIQHYLGKPLLVVYVNTPSPYQNGVPTWNDPRFTVRYMTGFITQQPNLRTDDLVSKFGYWSWEDRGPQTYSVYNEQPESMTIVAAWRNDPAAPSPGRKNGETFHKEWDRARRVGPKFALVVSWNEWTNGEQPSADVSKDIEPSREFGHKYLDQLKAEITAFKK